MSRRPWPLEPDAVVFGALVLTEQAQLGRQLLYESTHGWRDVSAPPPYLPLTSPPPEVLMAQITLEDWRKAQGYLAAWQRADGPVVVLLETAAGQGQVAMGDRMFVEHRWTYANLEDALEAVIGWQRAEWFGEPLGWLRHQPSNRRRHYSRPADPLGAMYDAGTYTEEVRA